MDPELGHWWETFQRVGASEREVMLIKDEAPKKRRKRRSKSESAAGVETSSASSDTDTVIT
jgi:poly(A) polymerase